MYPDGKALWRDGQLVMGPAATLTLTAFDAGIGLGSLEYRWGNGAWQRVADQASVAVAQRGGATNLQVRATDLLGLTSEIVSVSIAGEDQ